MIYCLTFLFFFSVCGYTLDIQDAAVKLAGTAATKHQIAAQEGEERDYLLRLYTSMASQTPSARVDGYGVHGREKADRDRAGGLYGHGE